MTTEPGTDTAVNARLVDGEVFLSASDLAAKFTETADTLDNLGPELCLVTGNDAATLFRQWSQALSETVALMTDPDHQPSDDLEVTVAVTERECSPCETAHPDKGCADADCRHNCQEYIDRGSSD